MKNKAATLQELKDAHTSGKSILQMMEAELVSLCAKYIRAKAAASDDEDRIVGLRHEIRGLAWGINCMRNPYERGQKASLSRIELEYFAKAKHLERAMRDRDRERK